MPILDAPGSRAATVAGSVVAMFTLLSTLAGCGSREARNREDPALDRESFAWAIASPAEAGLDPAPLDRLRQDAAAGVFPNLHAILVVKDGDLVLEEYFDGYGPDTRQYTASISKSVGSILVGIAMDQGLLPTLAEGGADQPVLELLPEYEDVVWADPIKRRLLLRHVLSMSAGLEWDETSYPYDDPRNDWVQARDRDDPVGFTLRKPVVGEPGAEFVYNGGLSILLSRLVQQTSDMPAAEFADRHLFSPLGIEDYEWERLPGGLTDTDGGLHMRPRDLAKIGLLYLNGGEWDGTRIVSEEWVQESTREHIINEGAPNYGYQWWCGDFRYADRSAYTFLASGHGGQKVFVFPRFDLVVVITHEVFDNPLGELRNTAILSRYVLPAADSALAPSAPGTATGAGPEIPAAAGTRETAGARATALEPDVATLARYAGVYTAAEEQLTIEYRDGTLHARAEGAPPMEMVALSERRFQATVFDLVDVFFAFDLTSQGVARAVRATWGFNDTVFERAEPDS
jgi:CubicO group peptidase (beta-lactamase class C family)